MKSLRQSPRAFFAFAFVLFFLVWIGLETEVFARAGGGRTSGRTSTGATRTYQKPPTQPSPAQQGDFQQQRTPSAPAPMTPSRGKRDWNGMRHILSPEMAVLFQRDIDRLLAEERINRIENIKIDGLVKCLLDLHPGESRGPEQLEITGFRLSPE